MITKCCLALMAVAVCSALPTPDERLQYEPQPQQYQQHEPQYQPQETQYQPQPKQHEAPHQEQQYKSNPYKEEPAKPYAFDYGVRDDYSGANFGHSETSNGNSVEGSYQVALPDGRIQIVNYKADHINGFQAQVEYEGEARYPEHVPSKEPSYKPEPYKQAPQHYQPHKPQPHKPSYKSEPQYHPSEQQQVFHEPQEAPVYHAEEPEYN